MLKDTAFCHLQENLVINMLNKELIDTETKTGTDAAKAFAERVVQKTSEATVALLEKIQLIKLVLQEKQKVNKK